jgi:hypothetical protein
VLSEAQDIGLEKSAAAIGDATMTIARESLEELNAETWGRGGILTFPLI